MIVFFEKRGYSFFVSPSLIIELAIHVTGTLITFYYVDLICLCCDALRVVGWASRKWEPYNSPVLLVNPFDVVVKIHNSHRKSHYIKSVLTSFSKGCSSSGEFTGTSE